MICSTSRPTYPTSVNLVASTLMKGARASLARRREISVLPTPVGPIIRMFFGYTSSRRSSGSCLRRQRLRRATAVSRLASFWPMMKRSSSLTISRGVRSVIWKCFLRSGCRCVDADIGGDGHGVAGDLFGGAVAVHHAARGGEGVVAARADGGAVVFRFQNVACAGDDI